MIYLDHAASTPLFPEALAELTRAGRDDFFNPSASYRAGRVLEDKIQAFAQQILVNLGLPAGKEFESIFTSGATESNNLSLQQWNLSSGDKVYCNQDEHPSLVQYLMHQKVTLLPIPRNQQGEIDYSQWLVTLDREAKGVVVSWVHGLTGIEVKLSALSQWLDQHFPTGRWHVDAAQAPGKVKLKLEGLRRFPDGLTFSGHKMGGPKGIGILLSKGKGFQSNFHGGGQQQGFRPGTLSWPLIAGLWEAWNVIAKQTASIGERAQKNRECVDAILQTTGFRLFFPQSSGFIFLLNTTPLPSDMVMRHLEEKGILVSTSSACSSKKKGPKAEFSSLGIAPQFHGNVLRVSFPLVEWDFSVDEVVRIYREVRLNMSVLFS
jgi:cysteine desulfurase